ncbi:hypothetical protein PV04_00473 [Phialophora macrospora]|uniref:Uncharacterized protein n=1 Tax=Phialophora macrospora TaxID=1851006 RepID=A0A0D2ED99_9EURO|nr:hypothetical protein PV04_00473 [Phialophora macrospora]
MTSSMNRQHLMKYGNSYHPSTIDEGEIESLIDDDDADDCSRAYSNPRQYLASLIVSAALFMVFLTLLLACAIAVLLVIRAISIANADEPANSLTCGNTPEEAQSRGCQFDVMSFTWVPQPCFDEALVTEFLESPEQPWHWFREPNVDANSTTTTALSFQDVRTGQFPELYVTNAYHSTHCTFTWKKLHRALTKTGYLDSYIGSYEHTLHCEHMLLSRHLDPEQVETTIRRKFITCRRINAGG